MTNKDIAGLFHELASLMELHEENPFKIRSYENAYLALRKLDEPLLELDREAWMQIKGIGATIMDKLEEIKRSGSFAILEEFRAKTPIGIRQILRIKGLGPKKVKTIWNELKVESPGELLYACYENRLVELKGFGDKLQKEVIQSIEYFNSQQNLFLFAQLEGEAKILLEQLHILNPQVRFEFTGSLRRAMPTLSCIELLTNENDFQLPEKLLNKEENYLWNELIPVTIYKTDSSQWAQEQLRLTGGSEKFLQKFDSVLKNSHAVDEVSLFESVKLLYIVPECRDLEDYNSFDDKNLISEKDIKGVIHNHSNYSDGIYSIEQMAAECIRLGYSYFVISDHSKSAFYANGLQEERLIKQWKEIDVLNEKLHPFKIYKSIESDILSDGSLDYSDEILKKFDLVIASVHSNLKMDEEKAMNRLIKAIENPFTRILGHPTGRLLLSRKGYPLRFKELIDSCIANEVVMELNANPLRLDMDWTWIPYAMEKGLKVSINPDAHNLKGIRDIRYGVLSARKGGLTKNNCLNTKSIAEFDLWIQSKIRF
ncbi:MAG: DNA polymerase/3'-5' exonuclease PolX [Saprospiraceae bacterium]|nr:DNA polymerase/3'-5' exonuclease PolX [Saprospiraceae bacterium]MBK8296641.1 DNA polymerase/3'-5' exonuclease PolX [Saprospiraceae bacterium]